MNKEQSLMEYLGGKEFRLDWNKWITPEKYKQLTGKDWPDDGPVWYQFNVGNKNWRPALLGNSPGRSTCPTRMKHLCMVIANEHGKPPADFIPEEENE